MARDWSGSSSARPEAIFTISVSGHVRSNANLKEPNQKIGLRMVNDWQSPDSPRKPEWNIFASVITLL